MLSQANKTAKQPLGARKPNLANQAQATPIAASNEKPGVADKENKAIPKKLTPHYMLPISTRGGRTTKENKKYTKGHVLELPKRPGAPGNGRFDRPATGPKAKPIVGIAITLPLSPSKTPAQSSSDPGPKPANTNPLLSPAEPLRERWRRRSGFREMNGKETILERSPGGLPIRFEKDGTEFVRAYKNEIKKYVAGIPREIKSALYQTAESAKEEKKFELPSPTAVAKTEAKMIKPAGTIYRIEKTIVDSKALQHKDTREITDKGPAKHYSVLAGRPGRSDHYHMAQHSIFGRKRAQAVLTEEQKKAGVKPDERSTLPGKWVANSMRLYSTAENPSLPAHIRRSPKHYKSEAQTDKIAYLTREWSTWGSVRTGNEFTTFISPLRGYRPSYKLSDYSRDTVQFTWDSDSPQAVKQVTKKPIRNTNRPRVSKR